MYISKVSVLGSLGLDLMIIAHSIRELSSFKTEHALHPSAHKTDSCTLHLFAFAIDPSEDLPINIHLFEVPNSLDGFTISSSSGRAAEEFSYVTAGGLGVVRVESSTLVVEIGRSDSLRALNACILVTSWVLTLGLACITVMGARKGRTDFVVLFLYVSVVLAIGSLQRLLVSPPPFGECIGGFLWPPVFGPVSSSHEFPETIGFLSQITVMTISSVVLVYNVPKPCPSRKIYPCCIEKT